MKGFIIYPTYKVLNNKAYVMLYGKLENGKSFLTINEYKPYFYIKTSDLKKASKLGSFESEGTKLTNFDKEPVTKIIVPSPKDVPTLREEFIDNKIDVYEADVKFATRFLIDHNLQGSIEIKGSYDPGNEFIDLIFQEPELRPSDYIPKNLTILSMDIETSYDGKKLYCIGLYSKNYSKSFIVSKTKVENSLNFETEEDLLEAFQQEVIDFDPDIITGWNVVDFDLQYLKNKFNKYRIPFMLNREDSLSKMKLEKSFFRSSKADFPGRVVLDGLDLMKGSFIKLPDYKLNTAAKHFLGKSKIIESTGKEKYEEIDSLYKTDKKKLIEYNLQDSKLAYEIVHESKVIELAIKRSLLTGMPLDRVNASIASLDFLYLQKAKSKGLVCPSSSYQEKERSITGGFVKDSEPGIYDNVLVLDFKSLYPSLIKTFNIDPASMLEKPKKDSIVSPNKAYFEHQDGILPEIITELWKAREEARKNKDELSRYAIKILMNSFFGVMASPACRFFSLKLANAITTFGQETIKLTGKKIEEMGYKVIYQDTDSNFVFPNISSTSEAEKLGTKIQDEINSFYSSHIKKEFNRTSYLELEFEKCYIRMLMPRIRGGEKGAKKRYAGLIKKDGKEEMQFVGLEFARSDWTDAAKEFQEKLLGLIFHKKEVSSFIKKFVDDLQAGKYDDKLVYRKSLRKETEEYTKTTPPHVKAARKLKKINSNLIEYYITTDGPEPIQALKHKIDYKHYLDKQLKPIADAVLSFYDANFDEIVQGNKQTTLFDHHNS